MSLMLLRCRHELFCFDILKLSNSSNFLGDAPLLLFTEWYFTSSALNSHEIFVLILFRRSHEILLFEFTEPSKPLVIAWSHSRVSLHLDIFYISTEVTILIHMRVVGNDAAANLRRCQFISFWNHGTPLTNQRSIKSARIFLMTYSLFFP